MTTTYILSAIQSCGILRIGGRVPAFNEPLFDKVLFQAAASHILLYCSYTR